MGGRRKAAWVFAVASTAAAWVFPNVAGAYSGGLNGGECSGCHSDGNQTLSMSSMPATISPGSAVTLRLTVNGSGAETGVFIQADAGSIAPIGGEGLATAGGGLTHASPIPLSGGQTTIEFSWTAPGSPGAVRFEVWNVVANGNNNSGGDGATDEAFDFVFGCQGASYYRDHDGDGYGRDSEERLYCVGSAPNGYATEGGDCDDNRDTVHPTATEYCNLRDDDCDGETDEEALPVEQYPDADGDGYYGASEALSDDIFVGCVPTEGYAAEPGDCDPNNGDIHPDAEEVCNLYDDNCDNRVDEGVRPTCGEGWCRRAASSCEASTCYPGPPAEEQCNFIDDDCNGLVDDGDICPAGQVCMAGECRASDGSDSDGSGGGHSGGGSTGETTGATDGAGQDGPMVVPSQSCAVAPTTPRLPVGLWLLLLFVSPARSRSRR